MAGLSGAVPTDDADLLQGAAGGDWQSIATLYDRHRDGALAVAASVLGDASEAEDVVHDAFVDLPRMARSYDPRRGKLRHWLYRSVRNRAIDHVRRRARWTSRMAPSIEGAESILAMTPQRGASPADEAEAHELIDLVARLDGRHAHVIRLAFVDGWSHSSIARLTGLPLGTVKTRIRNGLRQLRVLMADPDASANRRRTGSAAASRRPARLDGGTQALVQDDRPAILVGDRLGRVRAATPAAALLFDRTQRQLVGAFVTDLIAMPRETTERHWQELVSTGRWAGRTAARRSSGAPIPVWGRAWMPAHGGFVGVFAADAAALRTSLDGDPKKPAGAIGSRSPRGRRDSNARRRRDVVERRPTSRAPSG